MRADKENWIGEELKRGEYVVIVKTPWKSFVNEFSLSVYGPDKSDIAEIQEEELPKNVLHNILLGQSLVSKTFKKSFEKQGHPDIFYDFFDNDAGYGYMFFDNQSKDTVLNVTLEMLGSVNIEVCEPYSGLRPSLVLNPGEKNIIAFEATTLPYSSQIRMQSSFEDYVRSFSLKDKIRESDTVLIKKIDGVPVDIKVYVLYHQEGLALLYENNTDDLVLSEELEFELVGCHIDGAYGNYIEVVVEPGKERLLKIAKDNDVTDFSCKIKKLKYTIK